MKKILFLIFIAFALPVFAQTKDDINLKNILKKTLPTKEIQKTKNNNKPISNRENKLLAIQIRGNNHVTKNIIESEITLQIGDKINPFLINQNIKNIQSLGVFSKVTSRVVHYKEGKKLIITVKENPIVKEIRLDGNNEISDETFLSILKSKKDELLNLANIRHDIRALEEAYKTKGYFLAKIYKVTTPQNEGEPLIFKIIEGDLDEIIITGNTRTQDFVILREMDLQIGKPLDEKTLKKDLRKIYNLNYFSKLEPDFLPGDQPHTYKLKLEMEERSTGSMNFGGGYGQRTGGFAYADLNIDNLFGTGQLVALKGQWGRANFYQFKYHNPWMWDDRKSFTFRLWNTYGEMFFNTIGSAGLRTEERTGYDVAVGWPFSYELRTSHRIKNESIKIPEDNGDDRAYKIRSYTYTIAYDTRDVMFNPSEGIYHVLSIEKGFKVDESSLDFMKYDLTLSNFIPTFEKQTIATRLMFGLMTGELEDTEIYYVGGPNTVRGYKEYPYSFAKGERRIVANLEYRFLFNDMFQALLFIDGGWSNSLGHDLSKGKVGKGFGVRIMSPLGPIRLDFGIDEEGILRTHFNIGHVF